MNEQLTLVKKERDSRFELLRIFSMLLIVAHHFAGHGGGDGILNNILVVGGKLGVNLFVLISGYFLINSKINFQKVLKLILECLFYSIIIYFIFVILGRQKFDIQSFLNECFNGYWFVVIYLFLYLISPFLNAGLNNIRMKEHLLLMLLLFFLACVMQYISNAGVNSNLSWFVTLYCFGAFVKKYDCKVLKIKWIYIVISILSLSLMAVLNAVFSIRMWDMTNYLCVICSLSIFVMFSNFKQFNNKFINIVSSATFGVYLIHDNNFIRSVLWGEILHCREMSQSNYYILFAICVILGVYIVCTLIDLMRIYIIEKPLFKWINKKQKTLPDSIDSKKESVEK